MRFTTVQKIFIAREIRSAVNKIMKKTIIPMTERERVMMSAIADVIINLPSPEE